MGFVLCEINPINQNDIHTKLNMKNRNRRVNSKHNSPATKSPVPHTQPDNHLSITTVNTSLCLFFFFYRTMRLCCCQTSTDGATSMPSHPKHSQRVGLWQIHFSVFFPLSPNKMNKDRVTFCFLVCFCTFSTKLTCNRCTHKQVVVANVVLCVCSVPPRSPRHCV